MCKSWTFLVHGKHFDWMPPDATTVDDSGN